MCFWLTKTKKETRKHCGWLSLYALNCPQCLYFCHCHHWELTWIKKCNALYSVALAADAMGSSHCLSFYLINKDSSLYIWPPSFRLLGVERAFMCHVYQMAVTQLVYRHDAHKKENETRFPPRGFSCRRAVCCISRCPYSVQPDSNLWCIALTARLKTGSALALLSDTKLLAVNYLYDCR